MFINLKCSKIKDEQDIFSLIGGNPLLCLMHETQNNQDVAVNPQRLHEMPRAWRFRTQISLEHLSKELADIRDGEAYKTLRLFLKEVEK